MWHGKYTRWIRRALIVLLVALWPWLGRQAGADHPLSVWFYLVKPIHGRGMAETEEDDLREELESKIDKGAEIERVLKATQKDIDRRTCPRYPCETVQEVEEESDSFYIFTLKLTIVETNPRYEIPANHPDHVDEWSCQKSEGPDYCWDRAQKKMAIFLSDHDDQFHKVNP